MYSPAQCPVYTDKYDHPLLFLSLLSCLSSCSPSEYKAEIILLCQVSSCKVFGHSNKELDVPWDFTFFFIKSLFYSSTKGPKWMTRCILLNDWVFAMLLLDLFLMRKKTLPVHSECCILCHSSYTCPRRKGKVLFTENDPIEHGSLFLLLLSFQTSQAWLDSFTVSLLSSVLLPV